jgi:hypothetical protein
VISTFGGIPVQNRLEPQRAKSSTGRRGESETHTHQLTKPRRVRRTRRARSRWEAMAAAQKPAKRLGGMAEALAIAGDLGFPGPPAQVAPHPFPPLLSRFTSSPNPAPVCLHFARSKSPDGIAVYSEAIVGFCTW